jgi:hypothetical protein
VCEQQSIFAEAPTPTAAPVRHLHAKRCSPYHDHEGGGRSTYGCFSRSQLGTATEKVLDGEGERLDLGVYRFGRPIADVGAHACSCGDWKSCWHLAAALLLESGLRPDPGVVETGRRYAAARRARWEAEDPEYAAQLRKLGL